MKQEEFKYICKKCGNKQTFTMSGHCDKCEGALNDITEKENKQPNNQEGHIPLWVAGGFVGAFIHKKTKKHTTDVLYKKLNEHDEKEGKKK